MNPHVKLAASALPGEKKYILFAGAGVSKDAAIPTSWDLMLKTAGLLYVADNKAKGNDVDLEKWFIKSEYAKKGYAELIGKIYPSYPEQQSFLKSYLDDREIGKSHKGIAELAKRGIIRAIVTTNFDHYIEKALEEKGVEVQVISNDDDLKNSEPLIHCKAIRIYKPHGDLGKGALKNTPKDLEQLSPLMEGELIRILSEHGVMVLGYAGQDKGIQKVFKKRCYNLYPLFWINPSEPQGKTEELLKTKDYTYIPCVGAGQFIYDHLNLLERLSDLAPSVGSGPTISDLRYNFSSPKEPVASLYSGFLNGILTDLGKTRPDFTKFEHRDEAIVTQIQNAVPISYRFIEGALLASNYRSKEAIEVIYNFFGKASKLCYSPEGFAGGYYETDFDGFKFLICEMFTCFIASLLKNENWTILGSMLKVDIFIEKERDSKYVPFMRMNKYIRSLNEIRNKRLELHRLSVMADMFKDRFSNSKLAELISHRDFIETDYFLYLWTACRQKNFEDIDTYSLWPPRSCIYLRKPPRYIIKCESRQFLHKLIQGLDLSTKEAFIEGLKIANITYERFFRHAIDVDSPLRDYDLAKVGTRI